ncbi:MAG TPA: short-chain dehydrogenase [Gammaproteobacteria bacterium]|jgi:hypothetical protein|nr:short-chain dehydrogenase [Gammaproteobacteria bacterium]
MEKKTALITGATTGLGYELSKILAREGYHLVLVARNQEHLDTAKTNLSSTFNISIETIALDLSIPTSPKALYEWVQQKSLRIDLLVNNAGFGVCGRFDETDVKEEIGMIQLHAIALVELTKFLVVDMINRKNGKILNIASLAAFQPMPFFNVYAATKAFVLSFSESLASELQGTGVTVNVFCPGAFQSGFQQRARLENVPIYQGKLPTAEKFAEICYREMKKNKRVIIPGWQMKMLLFIARFLPRNLVTQSNKFLMTKRK